MPIDPNAPAFPRTGYIPSEHRDGISIRVWLAGMILQGIVVDGLLYQGFSDPATAVKSALEHADALIRALNGASEPSDGATGAATTPDRPGFTLRRAAEEPRGRRKR